MNYQFQVVSLISQVNIRVFRGKRLVSIVNAYPNSFDCYKFFVLNLCKCIKSFMQNRSISEWVSK